MTTKFYPFQIEDAHRIDGFGGRSLCASEMGLGKSATVLLYAMAHPKDRPVIIVCPKSLKWNWQRECAIHFNVLAEVLSSTKPPAEGLLTGHGFYIINYDVLGPWLGYLKKLKPKLVVLDECHYMSNRRAKRSRNVKTLCKGVPHVVAVSGTPLTNRPSELWPVLNLLRPELFPSFFSFAHQFCRPRLKPWGWVYDGAENLDLLHQTLSDELMIRRLKKDVLSQLPAKQRIVVPLEIEKRKEYKEASENLIAWLMKQSRTKARRAARAEQLVKIGHLKRLAGKLKLKSALEWVDSFLEESDEKIILFAVHKAVVSVLEQRYKNQCVVVTGSVTGNKRQQAFDRFVKDPKTRVFIGNTRAAGVGWSAKGVSTVAFLELDWVPGIHTQCEDRTHGIGRGNAKQTSVSYYLIAKDTIEEKLCHIIQKKQEVLSATLDGENGDDLPIFDQLIKELLQEDAIKNHNKNSNKNKTSNKKLKKRTKHD